MFRANMIFIAVLMRIFPLSAVLLPRDKTTKTFAAKEIIEAIRHDIDDAERLAGTDAKVHCDAGVATLAGTVKSILDKQLAGTIAKRIRGVEAVVNQMIVKRSDRDDRELRDEVRQAVFDLALESRSRHPHHLVTVRYHPPHGASGIYVSE